MHLYFAPLACSMATRISLHEGGIAATFIEVDPRTRATMDGDDYTEINPLGLVPTLRTDDGALITENAAILQHVAERSDKGALAPTDAVGKIRLRQWLSFIGTELHSGLFSSMLDRSASEDVRTYAYTRSKSRLAFLDRHLGGRDHLLETFTVADAYLLTVLNWAQATPVDLSAYPNIAAYLERGLQRPSVKESIALELPLYLAERERHRAS